MHKIKAEASVRVLFVDDEQNILRSIKRLFMEESYEVLTANSGEEALELLKDGQDIGLIVSDQRMPGMQGVDLLKHASEISPDTLRIMLTGYSDINAAIEAINKGGAYQYITKPWKDDELIQIVRDAVYRYSLIRENKRLAEIVKRQNEELKKWNDQLQYRVQEQTLEIRESEERFRRLFDEAPVGYHEVNKEGYITNVNYTELEMLGYTAEEMLGKPIWKFTAGPETVKQAFEAQIAGNLPPGQAFECDYCRKDGTTLVALAGDRLLKDQTGIISGIRTTIQDITERKRTEEKIASLQKQLHQSQKMEAIGKLKYKATLKKDYGNLPLTKCYPQQMNQVFMNLLINAGHAIEKQGEITIKTWNEDGSVWVAISDTGHGIPKESLNKIFEPFFTTKEVGKGTGLGLSITYEIVQKHNGEITAESEVGKGTTFTVRIPIV